MAASLPSTSTATELAKAPSFFPEYADDPIGFARDVLRMRIGGEAMPLTLWGTQADVCRSVAENTRTAVKSGHKVGKSVAAVTLALWWVMTRQRGQVILTSSGKNQVKAILWKELSRIYRDSGGDERFKPEHVLATDPSTGLRFDSVRTIYGFTTDNAERMQGFSGDQLLFLVDEASGFPDGIYEAVQGNMAGGGRILATGNPTRTTGWFFDAFHGKRHLWSTFSVDSRTTPNCTGGERVPGLAGPEWVEEMIAEYGGGNEAEAERHPVFAVRVAGQFPTQADNAVVGLGLIEAAKERWTTASTVPGRLQIGCDPAYFGSDDTVIYPRRGPWVGLPAVVHGADPEQVAETILQVVRANRHGGDAGASLPLVVIDDTGGYGAGPLAILRKRHAGEVVAVGVNASEASQETDSLGNPMYANRRAELWFGLGEWLKTGAIPPDPKAESEMLAPVYSLDAKGRRRVEPKDDIKKRLGRSPDRADALALAVYSLREGTAGVVIPDRPGLAAQRSAPVSRRVGGSMGGW